MMKNTFFGTATPLFTYDSPDSVRDNPVRIVPAARATLLLSGTGAGDDVSTVKAGDTVISGQRITVADADGAWGFAPMAGTVASTGTFLGDYGRVMPQVEVTAAPGDEGDPDAAFSDIAAAEPTLENAAAWLQGLPGAPDFTPFMDPENAIDTVVVIGQDIDLFGSTQQEVNRSRQEEVIAGIKALKAITGVERFVLSVPVSLLPGYGHIGCEVLGIDDAYPSAALSLVAARVTGRSDTAGLSWSAMGLAAFKAEAVASIGRAYADGVLPLEKNLTVIDKKGVRRRVLADIGTPLTDVLAALRIPLNTADRLINGGPMTGSALPSATVPVAADMDVIVVQDAADVVPVSDYPCVNCGECITICPTRVPVNMLVRFLEAGQYEEAAERYDLNACIDCGLCTYVCIARIPIFQYIRLAKYELSRMITAEETDEE